MDEVWKSLQDWPDYEISNYGRIRNIKKDPTKALRMSLNQRGAVCVNLQRSGVYSYIPVMRLVANHFVDGYFEGAEVRPKDGDKQNLKADNIEWVSHWDNTRWNTGRRDYVRRGIIDRETGDIEWL